MQVILPTLLFIALVAIYEWVRRKRRHLHRHRPRNVPGKRRLKQRLLRRIRYMRVYLIIAMAVTGVWIVVDLIGLMPEKPLLFLVDDDGNIQTTK